MRRWVALLAIAAALGWYGAAAAAETVAIRAAPHPGYGRIVFDWRQPAAHQAKLDGRTLTIRFARPFVAKLARIAQDLPGYVANVTLSHDRRTVRVALKGDYRLRSFDDKGTAVFDLLVRKVEAVASSGAAPALGVRAGAHRGFGRLVFDWKAPVGVRVQQRGDVATVRFDRRAHVDLGRLNGRLPPQIAAVKEEAGKGLTLRLLVPAGARLHHFTNGTSVVLDVFAPAAGAKHGRPARDVGASIGANTKASGSFAGKGQAERSTSTKSPDRTSKPASAPVALGPPTPLVPPAPAPAPDPRAIGRQADGPHGAGLVSVDVVRRRDISTFRFNWRRAVAAAVFRRRSRVWVMFDTPARIDVAALAVLGKPVVKSATQVPVVGGTAVQMAIDPTYHLRVRTKGLVWVVDAFQGPSVLAKPVPVVPQGSVVAGDARIVLPVPNPGKVLRLRDPNVGDQLEVVPIADPGRGVPERHWFVDATVLASAQGVAVHPLSDGVTVTSRPTEVTITRPGGLRLSSVTDRMRAESQPPPSFERLFNLVAWGKGPGKTPSESREILTRAAAEAAPAQRTVARLRLAHYFVAHGFGPEALGVLAQIARQNPAQANTPSLMALRGAAYYLAGEYGRATADLGIPVLANNVEAAPWRGAVAAARGDWLTAQREFSDLESVIGVYPRWLAIRFGLLAAEASLAVGDTGTAQSRLDVLADRGLTGGARDMFEVLKGYYLKDSGKVDRALALWRKVADHGDRRASARARFALAEVLFARKEITLGQAIDRMERLCFAWRGGVYEFSVLRRLAALYAKRGDSRDALETLKHAATYFHGIQGVQAVAKEMSTMFRQLFAKGGADKLQPVTALALFDEFRELTPPGPAGDAMVRKLAERLVSVDLLGDAARLLEQQVKFRVKGVEKARVGARLAQVRLMDNKPKKALAALDESTGLNLPAQLVAERRLARAKAFAELGRRTDALITLLGDGSLAAERLRARMAWNAKDWPVAAAAFDILIAHRNPPPTPDHRARLVLSRAVALALAGDNADLAALRDTEMEAMKKTKYAAAFAAVAGPASANSFSAAIKVAGDIGAVETMLGETRAADDAAAPSKTAIN